MILPGIWSLNLYATSIHDNFPAHCSADEMPRIKMRPPFPLFRLCLIQRCIRLAQDIIKIIFAFGYRSKTETDAGL